MGLDPTTDESFHRKSQIPSPSSEAAPTSFSGRAVAITEDGRGIGRATAERVLARGGSVALNGGDVADPSTTLELVQVAEEHFGGLDVFVINAGYLVTGSILPVDGGVLAGQGASLSEREGRPAPWAIRQRVRRSATALGARIRRFEPRR